MSYYTLAISVSSHDASIALLKDNEIAVAYSCERTSRLKHTGIVHQCDVDVIIQYTKHVNLLVVVNCNKEVFANIKNMLGISGITFDQEILDNDNHHLFHAAASYYTLGLDDAICIVVDGAGSTIVKDKIGQLSEATTFFYAKDTIQTIYKHFHYRRLTGTVRPGYNIQDEEFLKSRFSYPIHISTHLDCGEMYGTVTRYVGFTTMEAGKTMGLAGYGQPNSLPDILIPGTTLTNNNLFRNDKQIDFEVHPELLNKTDLVRRNMAYNVQRAFEKMYVEKVSKALTLAKSNNIILSGGCALNILGNSKVKRLFSEFNVYAEPIGTDASQSLGAALHYYKQKHPNTKYKKLDNLYLGPNYSTANIKTRLLQLVEQHNESTLQIIGN
ncbi:hypothetical protein OAU13_00925 [bacterium]|nr:hypothetical protein [bacterium]